MTRILIVEPDNMLGELYRQHLLSGGYDVVVCKTAADAVVALDKYSIDIVVLELLLPIHNGVEFLYEVRSYSEWQDLPIILHTSVKQSALHAGALERLGIYKYLYKPTSSLQDLSKSLTEMLRKK